MILKNKSSIFSFLLPITDLGLIFIAGYFSIYIRFGTLSVPNLKYSYCILWGCILYGFFSKNIYISMRGKNPIESLSKIYKVCAIVFLALFMVILFSQSGDFFSRIWLALWGGVSILLLTFLRLCLAILLNKIRARGFNLRYVAIIGDGDLATNLLSKIILNKWSGYILGTHIHLNNLELIPHLDNNNIDEVWIAIPIGESNQLEKILNELKFSPLVIRYIPDTFTFRIINHGFSEVLGIPMIDLASTPFVGVSLLVKNIEDFVLSGLILLFISPVLLIIAIGVKLTSPGPVFYRQERVGLSGRSFMMIKFRSMPVETEKVKIIWGGSNTKVIHRFSSFIRRFNLDELPQFWNVLVGEMSIVGPRPERSQFIHEFQERIPLYMKKHLVKAGITGWSQVHGLRGDTDLKKRIEYDLFYM